jgi:acyl-CoA synthetase (AMP-forming)/AMP-acid ligase II
MGPMWLRLLERLHMHALERPNAIALRQAWPDSGATLTWGQLSENVRDLANRLAAALPAGAVVMLCSGNRPPYVSAYLAILQAKMGVFPVAPDLAEVEMIDAARRCGAAAMIVLGNEQCLPRAGFTRKAALGDPTGDAFLLTDPPWKMRDDAGVCMLLLSSGTTATPKIVRRDAAALDAVAEQMVESVGFTGDDCVLAAVPLCHSYGVEHGLLAPIWAASRASLCDGFDRSVAMQQLFGAEITIFPGVPFMYEMLVEAVHGEFSLLKVRRAYSAGAPLPPALFEAFLDRFGVRVTQLYGATEIGSVTFNSPKDEPFEPTCVGRAMRDVQIAVLDPSVLDLARPLAAGQEGHVAIKAASMMSGYWQSASTPPTTVVSSCPKESGRFEMEATCLRVPQHDSPPDSGSTAQPPSFLDGYFLTGDLGRLDERGRLTITGRIKLLIDVGGRKVNPLEVERVIESHPAVGACIVVPMRISQTLLRLKAIVTPARKDLTIDPRELRGLARTQLSAYKVPRVIEIRDSLPRSSAGKILRHLVESPQADR